MLRVRLHGHDSWARMSVNVPTTRGRGAPIPPHGASIDLRRLPFRASLPPPPPPRSSAGGGERVPLMHLALRSEPIGRRRGSDSGGGGGGGRGVRGKWRSSASTSSRGPRIGCSRSPSASTVQSLASRSIDLVRAGVRV